MVKEVNPYVCLGIAKSKMPSQFNPITRIVFDCVILKELGLGWFSMKIWEMREIYNLVYFQIQCLKPFT